MAFFTPVADGAGNSFDIDVLEYERAQTCQAHPTIIDLDTLVPPEKRSVMCTYLQH